MSKLMLPDLPSPNTSADVRRAFVAEVAALAARYAEHVGNYAEMRDDAGLHRSVRQLAICATHAAEALPDLLEVARQERQLRDAARAHAS